MKYHIETIICPECGTKQAATVEHTIPFASYVQTCPQCQYLIMESEWNPAYENYKRKSDSPLTAGPLIEQLPFEFDVRALSWKQPYASLMLHGKIETRVWDTKYRGYVLICASKADYSADQVVRISGIHQRTRMFPKVMDFPKGQAIAIGKLVDSRPMTKADEDACFVEYQTPWLVERKRKDGTTHIVLQHLWCHIYEDVHTIEPFDWKGSQGWRTLTWEQKKKIIIL